MVDHRWQGYTHKELYDRINAGPGPAASFASMERWAGVSAALTEINQDLHTGITSSGARWQGKAAEQAQAGLNPLAAWADSARTGADVMRYSAELQAGHISKARADMPPPVQVTAEQPGALITGLTHLFGGQTDHEKQEAAQDAAERRAREVMTTYASSTTSNTSTLGQFTQPPQLTITTSADARATGPGVGTAGAWVVGPHGGTGGTTSRTRTGPGARTTTPPPRPTGAATPGTSTRTSGTQTPAASLKGTGTSTSSWTGTSGPAGTGTAGVVPGQRSSSRQGTSDKQREMQEGATATASAAIGPVIGQPGGATGSSTPSVTSMSPQGTLGASNNDRVHQRAVPLPQSYDPFGGMGPRKAEDEEDTVHKAADYLRERDDIYGVGSYTLPVIGESTTD